MHQAARGLRDGAPRQSVASIHVPYDREPLDTNAMANPEAITETVGQPEAAALVASGGWCAPSEPLFDLFDLGPDRDGLLDLPSLPHGPGR